MPSRAQLTPSTREWRQKRVALARRGLEQLKTFERTGLTDVQRVSADLMAWQLGVVVEGEKYEDFTFPLEQFGGENIYLVNALTITHPLNTEKDAVNYIARLRQVATRMEEATSEAIQLAEKRMAAAAIHSGGDHRADGAVHRDSGRAEPVRFLFQRSNGRRAGDSRGAGAKHCGRRQSKSQRRRSIRRGATPLRCSGRSRAAQPTIAGLSRFPGRRRGVRLQPAALHARRT